MHIESYALNLYTESTKIIETVYSTTLYEIHFVYSLDEAEGVPL